MKTLVIHARKSTDQSGNRSFEDTIATCTGEEFAISSKIYSELQTGMPLIILDKRQQKQAGAIVTRIEYQRKAGNSMSRYNIVFRDPVPMAYSGDQIQLDRCGVRLL